ncbi:ATP synthase F1 subunit delta [Candidatus Paracaedibacter symbiosus]|uniref:ATP synthase F1 subunit delta n=1 Tax=Candidatus Paracaedibacter symbiosus TaxID=244582 RepID=UPI000509CB36|nr:ATP synthase F1 subunit delta [Candidatus Paracaedibacter symbiosus]
MDSTNLDGQLASLPGRYARTLFELGTAEKKLAKIQEDLNHFNEILETVTHFKALLLNPVVSLEEQEAVLREIATQNKYDSLFLKFLCLLNENRRLNLFGSIRNIFCELVRNLENIKEVEVVSATNLTKEQQQKLQRLLATQTKSQLNFSYRLDSQVLGGFLVKIGCHVIDLTASNQINMLVTEMKRNA